MYCWKCGKELENPPEAKLPFRATCDFCVAWLHCCKNCINYKPGLPNDCKVPDTEYIADREMSNFCEDFSLLGTPPKKGGDADNVSKRLFGEERETKPKSFDDLF